MIGRIVMCATVVATMGCAGPEFSEINNINEWSATARTVVEGSPEAIGLLDFLNHPGTTFEVLDDEVPLDRRAAGNLMAHRNGGDGVFGSVPGFGSDDDLFGSIAEVDAVRWVGPASIERIADYAASLGFMPYGDDVLGTWDGVEVTANEAEAMLIVVNNATKEVLDDDIPLNVRAVNSIIDARPVASIEVLAGLYYVGQSALNNILDYSDNFLTPEERFSLDLKAELVAHYLDLGNEIVAAGGNSLGQAEYSIRSEDVWELSLEDEDPHGHDRFSVLVLSHPDVTFPGSDIVWFGAYLRATGELIEVYSFE